jgi:hypothetical protein
MLVVCHAGAAHEGGPPTPAVLLIHLHPPLLDLQRGGLVPGRRGGGMCGQGR